MSFGRILDIQATHISTKTWGTVSYMPAELLSKGKLTTATDVYSFGMLMWELMKSCRVLQGVSMGQVRPCCPAAVLLLHCRVGCCVNPTAVPCQPVLPGCCTAS